MKIDWTKLAVQDLHQAWDYVGEDNPDAADHLIQGIGKSVQNLISYPNMGRAGRVKGTRELVIVGTPYIIPYRVHKNVIEILSVLHGSRRWRENF